MFACDMYQAYEINDYYYCSPNILEKMCITEKLNRNYQNATHKCMQVIIDEQSSLVSNYRP